jgi:hypothetical protein
MAGANKNRSPHERSDLWATRVRVGPGYRFAHPGYSLLLIGSLAGTWAREGR